MNKIEMLKQVMCLAICIQTVSCDSEQKASSTHEAQLNPRLTKRDRSSKENPDSRNHLRSMLNEALQIETLHERDKALAGIAWTAIETAPDIFTQALTELSSSSSEKKR